MLTKYHGCFALPLSHFHATAARAWVTRTIFFKLKLMMHFGDRDNLNKSAQRLELEHRRLFQFMSMLPRP